MLFWQSASSIFGAFSQFPARKCGARSKEDGSPLSDHDKAHHVHRVMVVTVESAGFVEEDAGFINQNAADLGAGDDSEQPPQADVQAKRLKSKKLA